MKPSHVIDSGLNYERDLLSERGVAPTDVALFDQLEENGVDVVLGDGFASIQVTPEDEMGPCPTLQVLLLQRRDQRDVCVSERYLPIETVDFTSFCCQIAALSTMTVIYASLIALPILYG